MDDKLIIKDTSLLTFTVGRSIVDSALIRDITEPNYSDIENANYLIGTIKSIFDFSATIVENP